MTKGRDHHEIYLPNKPETGERELFAKKRTGLPRVCGCFHVGFYDKPYLGYPTVQTFDQGPRVLDYICIYIPRHSMYAIYADQLGWFWGSMGRHIWQSHGVSGIYIYISTVNWGRA